MTRLRTFFGAFEPRINLNHILSNHRQIFTIEMPTGNRKRPPVPKQNVLPRNKKRTYR